MPSKKDLGDAIPRDEPYVVPAKPEETYDSIWLSNINITAPQINASGNNQGNISIQCLPYNSTEKDIFTTADQQGAEYINVPSRANGRKTFWDCVNQVPEVAVAMNAITAAIPALRTWANTSPPPPSGENPPI